jgi:hypothetical protein
MDQNFQKSRLGVFFEKNIVFICTSQILSYIENRFAVFANLQDLIELFSLLKHDADQTEEQHYPKAFGSDSI